LQNIELEFLSLVNYRNYESLNLALNADIQVITGVNGAGKTTILDAIYYICNGKSYFTHLDRYIFRTNTDFFRLEAKIKIDDESTQHRLSSQSGKSKSFQVDDKKINSLAELVGKVPAFMIAPRDILILMESSIERRKVMDRTISLSDRVYLAHLQNYNKILKQRNAFLKQANKKGLSENLLLDSLDNSMLEPSAYIYTKRKEYLAELAPFMSEQYKSLSEASESVTLQYKSELNEHTLKDLQKRNLRKDIITGKTNSGIHRDDISIFLNDKQIKKYASEGQLKSAVIALKLAQIEWIKLMTLKKPILLLDDIFDKLDQNRVRQLLKLANSEMASQIFITDTDKDRVVSALKELGMNYNALCIEDGKVIE